MLGDHVLQGGYEREEFDVFNMFIQESEGEYRFSSVDDFGVSGASLWEARVGMRYEF